MTLSIPTFGIEAVALALLVAFVLGMSVGSATVISVQEWKRKRART